MRRQPYLKQLLVIGGSLILALALSILPLPYWATWFRPEWVVLVLIYWVMAVPHKVSVGFAWLVGLLVDALTGSLLGQHALALTLVAYLTVKIHRQVRMFPLLQQALAVMLLVIIYELTLILLKGMLDEVVVPWWYFLSVLTSMLIWPWLYIMLRDVRRHYKIR